MKKSLFTLALLGLSSIAMAKITVDPAVLEAIDAEIVSINKQAPVKVSDDVTLLEMKRKNDVLFSTYQITAEGSSAKNLQKEQITAMKQAACPMLKPTLEMGFQVKYTYQFADKSSKKLDLNSKECKAFIQ